MLDSLPSLDALSEGAFAVFIGYGLLAAAGLVVDGVLAVRLLRTPPDWAHAAPIRSCPIPARDAALLAFALLGLQALIVAAGAIGPELSPLAWLLINTAAFHGAGLAILALLLRARRIRWRDAFGPGSGLPAAAGKGILAYLAILPSFFAVGLAWQHFLARAGFVVGVQPVAMLLSESDSLLARVAIFAVAAGAAPLFEELFFRGALLPVLARAVGVTPAVLLVSAAFSFLHFHVPSFLPLMVLSVGLSLAYLRSGSIVTPVLMHAAFNAMNLVMIVSLDGGI